MQSIKKVSPASKSKSVKTCEGLAGVCSPSGGSAALIAERATSFTHSNDPGHLGFLHSLLHGEFVSQRDVPTARVDDLKRSGRLKVRRRDQARAEEVGLFGGGG